MDNDNKEINNTITFDVDGEKIEAEVLEQTVIENNTYFLVSKKDAKEDECYILKDVSNIDDVDSVFEEIEDKEELNKVYEYFKNIFKDDNVKLE